MTEQSMGKYEESRGDPLDVEHEDAEPTGEDTRTPAPEVAVELDATEAQGDRQEATAIEKAQPQGISPFDLDPERFKAALARRVNNVKLLLETINSVLREGEHYGPIHVAKNCDKGKRCTNPYHFSKNVLFKPGAEKINQFLGLAARYRPLTEQERKDYGITLTDQIVVKCEIVDRGQVVAEGLGARALDDRDGKHALNKALKMAEKSARINATIQLGLSDCYTQDLDDMVQTGNATEQDLTPDLERAVESAQAAKPGAAPLEPNVPAGGDIRHFVKDLECPCGSPVMERKSKKGSPFLTCSLYYDSKYGGDEKAKALIAKLEKERPELVGKHYYKPGKKAA